MNYILALCNICTNLEYWLSCMLILALHAKQVILLCMFERNSKVGIGKGDSCIYRNQTFFRIPVTRELYLQHNQLSETLAEATGLSLGLLVKFLVYEEQARLYHHSFRFHVERILVFLKLEWSFLSLIA